MGREQQLEATIAKLRKEHGEDVVVWGKDITRDLVPRCTSGALSLDIALGGGWAMNQWTEIIGPESSGKSLIIAKTIAKNQALDPEWTAFWGDGEGSYSKRWMAQNGVDNDRVIVFNDNGMEAMYSAAIAFLDSRSVDCVVIDSLPSLVPETEDAETMEQLQVGLGARVTNKFFRKQRTAMKRSLVDDERPVIGFLVNQWREKIGVMYGDPRTTPGGKMKNFACAVRVEMKRDDWIEVGGERVGQTIRLFTTKNKTAPPQREALLDFYFDDADGFEAGSFDDTKDLFDTAVALDVIVQGGGGIYHYGEQKWKGRKTAAALLRGEEVLREKIEIDVYSKLGIARPVHEQPVAETPRVVRRRK